MKKLALVLALGAIIVSFFYLGLDKQLSLAGLNASLDAIIQLRNQKPILVGLIFFIAYLLITAASLPGAAIMTLAAGALFGLAWGTLLVSFASSLGATLAFLSSRYLLRDSVAARFGERLGTIDKGIARDGGFYLFTLRLIPLFPFFVINLLMGLTNMKVLHFYGISQIGMLAGTLVYVNAGTQLGQVTSLAGILSPGLILSFALLGVFPLLAKYLVAFLRAQRVYQGWQKPKKFDTNLVVIGAGAAGLVSAYIGSAVKAKVTLIEAHKMGGDCLNYGCVPSKALIKSAKVAHLIRNAQHYGLTSSEPEFSFTAVMARIQQVIRAIAPHDSVERYTDLGVQVKQGQARIVSPWSVELSRADGTTELIHTANIVIAAGASPTIPSLPGLDTVGYLTSDTLWEAFAKLEQIPRRIVILGGGPIGTELAQALARLGAQVVQVERGKRILAKEDSEVSALVSAALERDGVKILCEHAALACESVGGRKHIVLEHQGQSKNLEFDALICAVGRTPRLTGYGLEALGIATQKTVTTNDYLATLYPNIFAAGDVAGPYQFTHVAAHQAWYATVNALFGRFKKFKVDYRVIPWTTFTDPEVARVGINEQEAKDNNIAYELTHFDIKDLDRAITDSADYGFIKVLTPPGKDKILGVTIVGEHAGDLLAEFVLAMKWGLGLNKILSTIHTYPTLAESNKYVAGQWKRAHAPQQLLRWVEKYHAWQRGE